MVGLAWIINRWFLMFNDRINLAGWLASLCILSPSMSEKLEAETWGSDVSQHLRQNAETIQRLIPKKSPPPPGNQY